MATATLLPMARAVFCDPTGAPLAGGYVNTYVPGGTTPKTTWQDAAATTPNENPIPLDADGSCLLYGSGSYNIVVTDANGNQVPAYSGAVQSFGPLYQDAGTFDNTGMHFGWQFLVGGLDPTTEYTAEHQGNFATQALISGLAVPSSSPSDLQAGQAFMAYVTSASTSTEGVAAAFQARALANGALLFGLNPLITDNHFDNCVGVGCEWDIGAYKTTTTIYGNNMIGVFPNGTPLAAIAYQVSALNSPWETAFSSLDGSAVAVLSGGAQGQVANSDGQPIFLAALDSSNTFRATSILAQHTSAGASLRMAATGDGVISLASPVSCTSSVSVTANAGALMAFFSGSTQVGSITTDGTTTTYGTTSDERLKTVHGPATGALIDQVKVYHASFKSEPATQRSMLLAHELQGAAPWAVTGTPGDVYAEDVYAPDDISVVCDGTEEVPTRRGATMRRAKWKQIRTPGALLHRKGDIKPQMVDYSKLVPDLIAKVQVLEARLAKLEGKA